MRSLDPEEAALWAKVAATIRPLSRNKASEPPIDLTPPPLAPAPGPAKGRVPPARPMAPAPVRAAPLHGASLDGSWDKKIRSGRVEVDRVLDLHGHSLDGAWHAIDRALEDAIRQEERVVLLITGHQRDQAPPVERGKIRAAVHDWLAHSRHAARIASVRGAHRRHGGGGSLYLVLRRG